MEMLSVGKLFAFAAIVVLAIGFVPWPITRVGVYTITIKNVAYGFSSDYWAFSVGALFATLAALYYWLPFILSLNLSAPASHIHFWLSTISALAILLLVPGWQAFTTSRPASDERGTIAVLLVTAVSILLFLLAQLVFIAACVWSVLHK
jgi:hypothetical protein